ncbi:MAG: 3-oxoacyl-ACP reductase [Moraxella sp.]|nr:3-oxoacyl-ACP reductase [Moraxella sp.]
MSDRYGELVQSNLGKKIAKNLGLPTPVALERYEVGQPILTGEVALGIGVHGTGDNHAVAQVVVEHLNHLHAHLATNKQLVADALGADAVVGFSGVLTSLDEKLANDNSRFKVVIFDATNLKGSDDLKQVYEFFAPLARRIKASGRVIVLARPDCCTGDDVEFALAQQALVGFVKSVAKEFKQGISANIIYVKQGLETHLPSALNFFMSPKSAYVSGQAISLTNDTHASQAITAVTTTKSLANKKILVTGAARGIGRAIATVLAREGASVVCLDVSSQAEELQKVAQELGGQALSLDITDPHAAQTLLQATGILDGVVHNAGITQDKTLAKMSSEQWERVMAINLKSISTINTYLLQNNGLSADARIVCVSSISGIAGNLGQTNYATSKAGVIGLTKASAKLLAGTGRTINAVAPGFIETKMTAAIPFAIREAGRRMNSMSQGGEPVDVAETIAWLLAPTSGAINGNVVRVCGQSLLGA